MPHLRLALLALAPAAFAAGPMTLREAADRALRNNLGLAVQREDTGKADDAIEIAQAAFDSVMRVNSGLTRTRTAGSDYIMRSPVTDSWNNGAAIEKRFSTGTVLTFDAGFSTLWGADRIASPDYFTGAGVSLRQPLLRGAGESVNLAPLARARLNLERTQINLRISATDLVADTAISYRNLSASRDLLNLRESGLRAAESLLTEIRTRRRPQIGTATEQDELQAASDVASRRVEVAEAQRSLDRAGDILLRLIGGEASHDPASPATAVLNLPSKTPEIPDFNQFMTAVDAFNPQAALGDIDIRTADTDVDAARQNDNPALDLVAGARTQGRGDSGSGSIEGLHHRNGHELSAALQFTMPLGMRESEASLRIARRSRQQAMYRLADTRRRAGFEARAAWRDLASARDRLLVADAGLKLQTLAYDNERARLSRGVSSLNDLLQAATRLDRSRLDRLSAALDCATAHIRCARLDGTILGHLGYQWVELDDHAGAEPVMPPEPPRP